MGRQESGMCFLSIPSNSFWPMMPFAELRLRKERPYAVACSIYEHKPDFEEGQRLAQHLLDSLLSSHVRNAASATNASKHVSKKTSDGAARRGHSSPEKRRSGRDFVSQHVHKVSNGDFYSDDSDLFSFDDVPVHVEVDDDVDAVKPLALPAYAAKELLIKDSRKADGCSTGISCTQTEFEPSALRRDISEDVTKKVKRFDSLHYSNIAFERQSVDEVSPQRNARPKISIQPTKRLQCVHTSSGKLEWKQQSMNIPYSSTHGVEFVSSDMGNVSCQHHSFDKDVPSGPLGRAFNQVDFARFYNLVALRVSLAESEKLADRLKGHLLNWPRISNISKVQGDDMNLDMIGLQARGRCKKEECVEASILQAVYGILPPLGRMEKRAKSAKKLTSNHFQYLECISWPGQKASKEIKEEKERQLKFSKHRSEKYYMVELLNNFGNKELLDDGLSLMDFNSKRWRGPFHLLLLDPKYAKQAKLPMAVQMLLNESTGYGKREQSREIVPCRLTLFYQYWSMEEIINSILPYEKLSLPIIVLGHVAVLCLEEQYSSLKFCIGKVILDKHRPVVKTVVNKTEQAEAYGLPTVEVLAGNHSLVTTIIENKTQFLINLAKMHWDSELAVERDRLIQKFSNKDIVCDVTAGAGALALPLAKKVRRVFANDPNVDAMKYLIRNIDDNGLHGKVEVYNLDCSGFLRKLLNFKKPVMMTQIVFSLPTTVECVIDALRGSFVQETWPANQALPTLHVYGYSNTLNSQKDFAWIIMDKLQLAAEAVELSSVKTDRSGRHLICVSFQLPDTLAFNCR